MVRLAGLAHHRRSDCECEPTKSSTSADQTEAQKPACIEAARENERRQAWYVELQTRQLVASRRQINHPHCLRSRTSKYARSFSSVVSQLRPPKNTCNAAALANHASWNMAVPGACAGGLSRRSPTVPHTPARTFKSSSERI